MEIRIWDLDLELGIEIGDWDLKFRLGIGDWGLGLGIGDWGLGCGSGLGKLERWSKKILLEKNAYLMGRS